jgi:hypothetical protein
MALTLLQRPEMAGKTVPAMLPNTADCYASSGLCAPA